MRDTVRYAVGFGVLGEIARRAVVARDVAAIFAFRAERVPGAGRGVGSGVRRGLSSAGRSKPHVVASRGWHVWSAMPP